MPITTERLQKMQEYGLTEYEARTYLALLDLGVATARDIANLSRVPRTKIYSVLDDLHAKSLAEIIPERPKKYECVPFDRYLKTFEREYQTKLKKIEEDRTMLATASASGATAGDKAGSFNVLKGRKNVINRKYEMIGRAKRSILEFGTEYSGVRMGYYMPMLRERGKDGVDVRVLLPVGQANLENVVEVAGFGEVRHASNKAPGSVILVVDDEEVLICHYVPDDEHLFKGEDVAIWSDDKAIVRDVKTTILANWEQAEPLDGALKALKVKVPGRTPSA